MAKAFALRRSTSQPVTIDTIATSTSTLGSTIPGMQVTSLFPGRTVNLFSVFGGDPYVIDLTATGNIEIRQFVSGAWNVVAGPYSPVLGNAFTPLALHVVNDRIWAIWTETGVGEGIRVINSADGVTWSSVFSANSAIPSSFAGHSINYRGAIWFASSSGLWAIHPLVRRLSLAGIVGTFQIGEQVISSIGGATANLSDLIGATAKVDTMSNPDAFVAAATITGATSGATATISSATIYEATPPDTGDDAGLGGATGPSNLIGCFASWDGVLYFLQPKTAAGPIKLYQLNPSWRPNKISSTPQWVSQTFSGLVDAGAATVVNDAGMWCLFNNKADELSIFYSGATGTKLAKTTSKTVPLVFTDVTNTLLSSALRTKTYLGITMYSDDRRRDNFLHWFFVRDPAATSTHIVAWDGTNETVLQGSLTGSDYLLPASRHGEESTFTNLQPAVEITAVSQPFVGRVRIDYIVRCSPSASVDIIGEYSVDGDTYSAMSEGDGDSGSESLPASPSGTSYFFNWDCFADLDGDFESLNMRILARISGI